MLIVTTYKQQPQNHQLILCPVPANHQARQQTTMQVERIVIGHFVLFISK